MEITQEQKELATDAMRHGMAEFTFRHGAAKELVSEKPILNKCPINIVGNSGTVAAFIHVRKELLNPTNCNIDVNLQTGEIALEVNEKRENNTESDIVKSIMKRNSRIEKLTLNTNMSYTPKALFALLRNFKHFAVNAADFGVVLNELALFKAKKTAEINDANDRRGSTNKGRVQNVEHSIPESFVLNMPIISKEKVNFTVLIEIDEDGEKFLLFSEDLVEKQEAQMEKEIATELKAIGDFCFVYFT